MNPQATSTPSLGPLGRTAKKVASRNSATSRISYRSRRWNAAKRSRSSLQIRAALALDTLPSPASSQSDSTSRIDSPRTNAPITSAFNGSVRNNLVPRGNSRETKRRGRLADLRDLDLKLALGRLQRPGAKPIAHAGLDIGPALVAGPAQPRVELLLDRALDDQPRAELRQLRHAARGSSPTPTANSWSI